MADRFPYLDILDLPHPVSARHKPMDPVTRGAQFSPFAALTGYEGVIREEQRLTTPRPSLSEEEKSVLDQKLSLLAECQMAHPLLTVRYFRSDPEKPGGDLVEFAAPLRDVNGAEGVLIFTTGETVPFRDLVELECDLFRGFVPWETAGDAQ
ncbi:MAG: hypothetical protein II776_05170 [Clostridia bacterium]|nr:hypothetical protein [Clostridia bacterium]